MYSPKETKTTNNIIKFFVQYWDVKSGDKRTKCYRKTKQPTLCGHT
jgi:hypothetical protein